MQWMWAAVLAAAAVTTLAAPRARAAQDSDAPASTRPATPDARTNAPADGDAPAGVGATVAELAATLTDPSASAGRRNEAARRLVARQTAEARAALRQALTEFDNPAARTAAARALADDLAPDPATIPALLELLNDNDVRLVRAGALALANYKGDARGLTELSAAATRRARPANLRIEAVRALGLLVEQPAAATLYRILTAPGENAGVAEAAADALVEMTALDANGRDVTRWRQWFEANGSLPEAAWKANVLNARARRHDHQRREAAQLVEELRPLLEDQYRDTDDKPGMLLRYLGAASPEIRRVGARVASDVELGELPGGPLAGEVRDRLLDLVGDADASVRLVVARGLYDINPLPDRALPVLLAQLRIETSSDVKVAIIGRLGRIPGIGHAEDLSRLLGDPSPAVVRAVAEAIEDRAADVEKDRPLATRMAARLRETITRLGGQPGAVEARKAAGEALALLRDPESFNFALKLLNPQEAPGIRGVALHVLGELGPNAADIILRAVDDERDQPAVRVEAMKALTRTRSFDQSEWLVQRMAPRGGDPSEDVRKAARRAYLDLIPFAPTPKLAAEAQRRKNAPELREPLLRELIRKLKARGQPKDLMDAALQQQNLGVLLQGQRKFPEAVVELRAALDYLRKQGPGQATNELVQQLRQAMLMSKQYAELVALAENLITNSPPEDRKELEAVFGSGIRNFADQLVAQKQLDDAAALIDAALAMDPPLDELFRRELRSTRDKIGELRQAQQSGPGTR